MNRTFADITADIAALNRPEHPCSIGARGSRRGDRVPMTPAAIEAWKRALAEWRTANPDGDSRYEALLAEYDALEESMAREKRMAAEFDNLGLPGLVVAALKSGRRSALFDEVDAWLRGELPWLVMLGPSGVGKSCAGGYALHRQVRAGKRARWQKASTLVREIGSAFDSDAAQRLEMVKHVECLVLDDLGAEHRNEFTASLLFEVLQHRHEESLRTIVTTNLNPEAFRERVGSRLYDRIRSACVWAVADGQSLRGRAA